LYEEGGDGNGGGVTDSDEFLLWDEFVAALLCLI